MEETLEKLRTVKTRDGLFALRVAVTVSTAAVPTLPFTRRHFFYAGSPSNVLKFKFTVTLHHEIKRLCKQ